jgi:hypothetical protein
LYQVVRDHLDEFLGAAREHGALPPFMEHVLPQVPFRQWVVSYPFEMNGKLAFQPQLISAVERVVMRVLSRWYRDRGGGGQPGGLLVRHRFGNRRS